MAIDRTKTDKSSGESRMSGSSDTICAISTPPGQGGIAIIRICGNDAFAVCGKIFKPYAKQRTGMTLGVIFRGDEIIDEALVSTFHAPHSYTGEDMVEINCHGSLYIQRETVRLLLSSGCRLATAGEFTQRAFLNGKIDLSQAEAVSDLIASSSESAHRLAIRQMRGGISAELSALREKLLDFTSLVELELDFAEEDVEFADRKQLNILAMQIETSLRRLVDSFEAGNAIKNGIPVAIVGETNAGKSTLLNGLLKEERAIVSDIHGTTRDTIEDTAVIGGLMFRFIDTAGIRETDDHIEQLGIERSLQKIEQASIVLWVIDLTGDSSETDALYAKITGKRTKEKKLILTLNKADKLTDCERKQKTALYSRFNEDFTVISAKSDADIAALERKLFEAANIPHTGENDVTVSNLRHYEALVGALSAIERVIKCLNANVSGDFLAQDIRECTAHLGRITGQQIDADDVLRNIFSRFCIGK